MADYLVSKFDFVKVADDDDVSVEIETPNAPIYPIIPKIETKANGYNSTGYPRCVNTVGFIDKPIKPKSRRNGILFSFCLLSRFYQFPKIQSCPIKQGGNHYLVFYQLFFRFKN